jgi:hypothetical protein
MQFMLKKYYSSFGGQQHWVKVNLIIAAAGKQQAEMYLCH